MDTGLPPDSRSSVAGTPAADAVTLSLIAAMNEGLLPGLCVGTVVGDEERVYALGTADARTGTPIAPSTRFRIGSVTKLFTAIGVMQLWEAGAFQLDDPVNRHLSAFRVDPPSPAAPPITVRHLLTHTAGIGELRRYSDALRPYAGLGVKAGQAVPELRAYYGGALRAEVPAGTKWAYANHGFAVLGQLIEELSGLPLATYFRERIFDPLGMASTGLAADPHEPAQLATGYDVKRGTLRPVPAAQLIPRAAGAVSSSASDLLQFVRALLHEGANEQGRILRPETLRQMLSPQYVVDPRLPAMGLGFMLWPLGVRHIAGHGGGLSGFVAHLMVAPDATAGVVVLANASTAPPIVERIAAELMRRLLGEREPASQLPRPGVLERPLLWPELRGAYGPSPGLLTNLRLWVAWGGAARVVVRDGHLALRSRLPVGPRRRALRLYPLDATDPLLFGVSLHGSVQRVLFQRDAGGRVHRLAIWGSGMASSLQKRPPLWRRLARCSAGAVRTVAHRSRPPHTRAGEAEE